MPALVRCALNVDQYVAAADPAERTRSGRTSSGRSARRASPRCARSGTAICPHPVRRTYILTTADTLVPPELQRTMAASLDAEIVEIATGHGPFREQPQRLAEMMLASTK